MYRFVLPRRMEDGDYHSRPSYPYNPLMAVGTEYVNVGASHLSHVVVTSQPAPRDVTTGRRIGDRTSTHYGASASTSSKVWSGLESHSRSPVIQVESDKEVKRL